MDKPKDEKFLALQARWYKKLEKEGFRDIEQSDGNLKRWDSHYFKVNHNETLTQAKQEYFRLAGQFLHEHKFEDKKEQAVWELHADGTSYQSIAKILKNRHFKISSRSVRTIIEKLKNIMGKNVNRKK